MSYEGGLSEADKTVLKIIVGFLVALLVLIAGCCAAVPPYRLWSRELRGRADLKEAEWNRRIKVLEAEAAKDAAAALAAAEVERAKGVAEANAIIGGSLKDNEEYLRYLFITSFEQGAERVVYIPTEAGIPILEAGDR